VGGTGRVEEEGHTGGRSSFWFRSQRKKGCEKKEGWGGGGGGSYPNHWKKGKGKKEKKTPALLPVRENARGDKTN